MPDYKYIGKATTKVDALERVTGQAQFGADISLSGMLHGKVLRSPHPHAKIKKIDYSEALKLDGVKAVVTAADLPDLEDARAAFGGELIIDLGHLRKYVIAHDKALFEGHAIAAVAATTVDIAEQALNLIKVDYEVLPPVETALQAMEPDAPLLNDDLYTKSLGAKPDKPSNIAAIIEHDRGDVDKAFQESDIVVEETYDTLMVHQGYIEPQACLASADHEGKVTLWTSTQGTFNTQNQISASLKLPLSKINVVPMEIGGAFGGKIYAIIDPLAIMLSQKTRRPVKIVMSREEVLKATGPASPAHITIKVGATRDGKLTACSVKHIYDGGCFPGAPINQSALVSFGPYKTPNLRIKGYDVVTNKPRVQAYRAPGGPPMGFAVESTMDILAEKLGLDPLEFRLRNHVSEGDLMTNDQPYNRIGIRKLLETIKSHPHWNAPLEGPNRGRGVAVGFWLGAVATSSAEVLVNWDGTVSVISGQVDLTGTRTTTEQIAAEELQLPLEDVTARVQDTESSTYTVVSAGSRTTYSFGTAVHRASHDALKQMNALAAEQLQTEPEDIEYADRRFWSAKDPEKAISWLDVAKESRSRGDGPVCGKGAVTRLQSAPEFAGSLADVQVDPETGKVTILRFTIFQDAGKAINPQQVEGQMQGGASQGIGWGISEYYHYKEGKLLNASLLDYRCLTALDLPMIDTEIVEVPASDGPYGARGVGECSIIPPAAAMANAIYSATGVRMRSLPMNPEAVFWAMQRAEEARVAADDN